MMTRQCHSQFEICGLEDRDQGSDDFNFTPPTSIPCICTIAPNFSATQAGNHGPIHISWSYYDLFCQSGQWVSHVVLDFKSGAWHGVEVFFS